ncbi:hypothetical protein [Lysobacter sp. GCM10012299]|uniref:hypothetical protein n=1 Tax=Lysobacter sp. GCM10012299 TaxID=3317333 RepID=UPI003618B53A
MGSAKIAKLQLTSREQWMDIFIKHASQKYGMDRNTATYEAEFAADDQEELNGDEVGQWPYPTEIAEKVALFWNEGLSSVVDDDASDDSLDSAFDFSPRYGIDR